MEGSPLVVVSNRGPVSFHRADDGSLEPSRGAGGLVSTLGPALRGADALWLAAAITDADREAAAGAVEAEGFRLRLLSIPEGDYDGFYNGIANGTLWFAYHGLYDLTRSPRLDDAWHEAWQAYIRVNDAFAQAAAEEAASEATVLVHDLHFSLVGARLRELRPDLRTAHFAHTPFCWPDGLAVLPDNHRRALMEGLASHGACGFHTERWARAFAACTREVLDRETPSFVSPAAVGADDLPSVAAGADCARHLAELEDRVGDRALLVRVDRMELSKNILRGFDAYDRLLRERPRWRERVVFGAFCYPSREGVAEYRAYRDDVVEAADRINEQWGTADWTPVHLSTDDEFPRSVAALCRADVLLVNPVRDGLNMVAKELALVNQRGGVLCLSPEAGAWEELGGAGALEVSPFDVVGTAAVLDTALSMAPDERAKRLASLRSVVLSRRPEDWLADQVAAAR
jgi:trehalose 6-phosphate synthase